MYFSKHIFSIRKAHASPGNWRFRLKANQMWGVGGGFRPPRASISVPQNFLVLKGVELCQKAFRGYQKHVFKAFPKAVGFFI